MKVVIKRTVSGQTLSYTLADDNQEGPDGLNINGQNSVQVVNGCRWTDADVFDRGNELNTITFSVTKGFTTVALAEASVLYHKSVIRGRWDVWLFPNGTSNWKWIKNAAVRVVSISNYGCAVRASYEIIGGKIRQTPSET